MESLQVLLDGLKEQALLYCQKKGHSDIVLYLKGYDEKDIYQEIYGERLSQHSYFVDKEEVEEDRRMENAFKKCFEPLSEHLGDMVIRVNAPKEEVTVFSEVESSSLEVIAGQGVRDYLYNQFVPFLKKGVDYIYDISIGEGASMLSRKAWPLMSCSGKEVKNDEEYNVFSDANLFINDALIRLIAKTLPTNCKIEITFSDKEKLSVNILDDVKRVEEFKQLHMERFKKLQLDKMVCTIDFTKYLEGATSVADVESQAYNTKGDDFESTIYVYDTEAMRLCRDLNIRIEKMQVIVTVEGVVINADHPIEKLGIGTIEVEKLESASSQLIFTYMESGNQEKIEQGLSLLNKYPDIKKLAERRYLNFVKAVTEDEKATLADMVKLRGDLDAKRISVFFRDGYKACFKEERFLLGLTQDINIKMLVDFIGSTVKNYINIDEVIDEINTVYAENGSVDTNKIINKYQKHYKKMIKEQVKEEPTTWYTKALSELSEVAIEEVYFDSVGFDKASKSSVLREFIFFLHMVSTGELVFNIYESSDVKLTDAIWLYKVEPEINMVDSWYSLDECPLNSSRVLSVYVDDEEKIYRAND